jgi:hypothetical protein
MRSSWSVYGSAPVPHADTYRVGNGCDHRCLASPVHGKLDEVGIYGEQHHVGGYPAVGRRRVRAQTWCPRSPRSLVSEQRSEV